MPRSPRPEAGESGQPSVLETAQRWFFRVAYAKPKQFAEFVRSRLTKWRHALVANGTASLDVPPTPTLVDLANETDALLTSEVRNGSTLELETLLDDVRQRIFDNKITYAASPVENEALDRLWVNLLRLGLFDELAHLVKHHNLPLRPEVRTFIDYCEREYAASKRRGEAYRAKNPEVDIFTMGCIVWGDEYVGNFLRYNLRSMLSQNNLPALRTQGRIVCSIVTDAAGELRMRRDALFDKLSDMADVEFIVVRDEIIQILTEGHLVPNFYILYGMLNAVEAGTSSPSRRRSCRRSTCSMAMMARSVSPRTIWRRLRRGMRIITFAPRSSLPRTTISASTRAKSFGRSRVVSRSIPCSYIRFSPAPLA